MRTRALLVANKVNRPKSVDVSYAHGGLTSSFGHPVATYEGLAPYRRPAPFDAEETERVRASRLRDNDAYYIIDTALGLEKKWPLILDGKPVFIKVYLFDSNEYEERRRWADRVGHTGLDPRLVPLIVVPAPAFFETFNPQSPAFNAQIKKRTEEVRNSQPKALETIRR